MSGICRRCERRVWLLQRLSVRLDYRARDPANLWDLLGLPDAELIDAVGGRRRAELHLAHASWTPSHRRGDDCSIAICRHHDSYPIRLRGQAISPTAFLLRGGAGRLKALLDEKVVAIVGTPRASDYGMETARLLGRGLASSGVTVASALSEGIGAAVHAGVCESDGAALSFVSGKSRQASPAWIRDLRDRVTEHGCQLTEPQSSNEAHLCWDLARARTLALLADAVVVIEAADNPRELACARLATSRKTVVAAVPGRVSSATAQGTHALLIEGARLVRNARDVLDAVYGANGRCDLRASSCAPQLEPRLRAVFDRVTRGEDTLASLLASSATQDEVVLALAELELRGLLVRGDAERYVPSICGVAE